MTTLRLGVPYWLAANHPRRTFPALARDTSTEVAIIGAGLTGCAAALAFAEAGIETVVLEAESIGLGSTAASTALLMQEPDRDFHELRDTYGLRFARRVWQVSREATSQLTSTIRRLGIACDLTARDSVYFAADARSVARLEREHRSRVRAGFGGRWLGMRAVRRVAHIDAAAAILTTGNAQLDPYRACVGLARAASRTGAAFYERSPVRRVTSSGSHVEIRTEKARVRASRVIVATGYATREFAGLYARFKLNTTYVIATPPLQDPDAGPHPCMLWDTRRPYHYVRWTSDGRLMAGGDDERRLPDRTRARLIEWHADRLQQFVGRLYPSLAHVRPAYAWEGLFASTPDGLPYIGPHRRYPRHLFALGYGGNGMTFGFLAAAILVRQHRGIAHPDDRLFAFARRQR